MLNKSANSDDVAVKHLFATQSIATILIYFIWSAFALGVGVGFAYIPVVGWDGWGSEPDLAYPWLVIGFIISAGLQIYGVIKASSDLKKSRI